MMANSKDTEKLKKLGVSSLLDLAILIPKSFDNTYINQTPALNEINTIHVKVIRSNLSRVLSLRLFCETWDEEINGVVFNPRAYHRGLFKVGADLHVRGKVEWQAGKLSIVQPLIVTQINTILPKYKTVLQNRTMIALVENYLTCKALEEEGLKPQEAEMIMQLHTCKGLNENSLHVIKFVEIYNYIRKLNKKKIDFKSKNRLSSDESDFVK